MHQGRIVPSDYGLIPGGDDRSKKRRGDHASANASDPALRAHGDDDRLRHVHASDYGHDHPASANHNARHCGSGNAGGRARRALRESANESDHDRGSHHGHSCRPCAHASGLLLILPRGHGSVNASDGPSHSHRRDAHAQTGRLSRTNVSARAYPHSLMHGNVQNGLQATSKRESGRAILHLHHRASVHESANVRPDVDESQHS